MGEDAGHHQCSIPGKSDAHPNEAHSIEHQDQSVSNRFGSPSQTGAIQQTAPTVEETSQPDAGDNKAADEKAGSNKAGAEKAASDKAKGEQAKDSAAEIYTLTDQQADKVVAATRPADCQSVTKVTEWKKTRSTSVREYKEHLKTVPNPRMLWDDKLNLEDERPGIKDLTYRLIYEDTITLLYGRQNVGKSFVAFQIADSVARRFPDRTVLYVDLEMSDPAYKARMADSEESYTPPENFRLMMVGPEEMAGEVSLIEEEVEKLRPILVIVDNLSCLTNDSRKEKEAKDIFKAFRRMRDTYGMAFLLLAHVRKNDSRGQVKPIDEDDLKGTNNWINKADSHLLFSGTSACDDTRYIYESKCRFGRKHYDHDHVLVGDLHEDADGLVRFHPTGFANDFDLFPRSTSRQGGQNRTPKEKEYEVLELRFNYPKCMEKPTQREIYEITGVKKTTFVRIVNDYLNGKIKWQPQRDPEEIGKILDALRQEQGRRAMAPDNPQGQVTPRATQPRP